MISRKCILRFVTYAAVAAGIFAATATTVSSSCPPHSDDPASVCVSYQKAAIHPVALLSNSQGSLVRFITYFLSGFVTIFAVLCIVRLLRAKFFPRS